MSNSDLQQLEQEIKEAQKIVDLGDSLERLRNNRDFKKVILEAYFEQEAVRLVHLKSDANMQSPEAQRDIEMQMYAIGGLSQFFKTLGVRAQMARRSVDAGESVREEMLQEDA